MITLYSSISIFLNVLQNNVGAIGLAKLTQNQNITNKDNNKSQIFLFIRVVSGVSPLVILKITDLKHK